MPETPSLSRNGARGSLRALKHRRRGSSARPLKALSEAGAVAAALVKSLRDVTSGGWDACARARPRRAIDETPHRPPLDRASGGGQSARRRTPHTQSPAEDAARPPSTPQVANKKTKMTVKRRSHGRNKKGRGHVNRVRCASTGKAIPKDKAIKRFIVRNIVDASSMRDIRDASAFETYALPKIYIKQYYCIEAAVHQRIVRSRSRTDRRNRDPPPRFRR